MVINIKIKPGAKRNSIMGFKDGYWHIAVSQQPIEGKANRALMEFLAKQLGIAKSCISILKGSKSRLKKVEINCISEKNIIDLLGG